MSVSWNDDEAYRIAKEGLNRKLASVRCPDHGQQARVIGSGRQIAFEEPCCQKLADMTAAAITDHPLSAQGIT